MSKSQVEEQFAWQIRCLNLPEPVREHRFHPIRHWRFDFAWPDHGKIAAEIEGGTWSGGRHTRGDGFEKDCEKYAEALLLGWRVFRFTSSQVTSGYAASAIEQVFSLN